MAEEDTIEADFAATMKMVDDFKRRGQEHEQKQLGDDFKALGSQINAFKMGGLQKAQEFVAAEAADNAYRQMNREYKPTASYRDNAHGVGVISRVFSEDISHQREAYEKRYPELAEKERRGGYDPEVAKKDMIRRFKGQFPGLDFDKDGFADFYDKGTYAGVKTNAAKGWLGQTGKPEGETPLGSPVGLEPDAGAYQKQFAEFKRLFPDQNYSQLAGQEYLAKAAAESVKQQASDYVNEETKPKRKAGIRPQMGMAPGAAVQTGEGGQTRKALPKFTAPTEQETAAAWADYKSKFPDADEQGFAETYGHMRKVGHEGAIVEEYAKRHEAKGGISIGEKVAGKIPFLRYGKEVFDTVNVARAAGRIEKGEAEPSDYRILGEHMGEVRRLEKRGNWSKAADIMTDLPAFGIELYTTGGVYTAGRMAAASVGKAVLGGAAKSALGRATMAVAPRVIGLGAQTLANAPLVASNITKELVNKYGMTEDAAGNYEIRMTEAGKGIAEAAARGYLDAFIEIGSEKAGGLIGKGALRTAAAALPKSLRNKILDAGIGAALAKSGGKLPSGIGAKLKEFGYHGIAGEFFEERLGDVARGATGLSEDFGPIHRIMKNMVSDPKKRDEAFNDLVIEAIALAVPGAAMVGASAAGKGIEAAKQSVFRDLAAIKSDPLRGTNENELRQQFDRMMAGEQAKLAKADERRAANIEATSPEVAAGKSPENEEMLRRGENRQKRVDAGLEQTGGIEIAPADEMDKLKGFTGGPADPSPERVQWANEKTLAIEKASPFLLARNEIVHGKTEQQIGPQRMQLASALDAVGESIRAGTELTPEQLAFVEEVVGSPESDATFEKGRKLLSSAMIGLAAKKPAQGQPATTADLLAQLQGGQAAAPAPASDAPTNAGPTGAGAQMVPQGATALTGAKRGLARLSAMLSEVSGRGAPLSPQQAAEIDAAIDANPGDPAAADLAKAYADYLQFREDTQPEGGTPPPSAVPKQPAAKVGVVTKKLPKPKAGVVAAKPPKGPQPLSSRIGKKSAPKSGLEAAIDEGLSLLDKRMAVEDKGGPIADEMNRQRRVLFAEDDRAKKQGKAGLADFDARDQAIVDEAYAIAFPDLQPSPKPKAGVVAAKPPESPPEAKPGALDDKEAVRRQKAEAAFPEIFDDAAALHGIGKEKLHSEAQRIIEDDAKGLNLEKISTETAYGQAVENIFASQEAAKPPPAKRKAGVKKKKPKPVTTEKEIDDDIAGAGEGVATSSGGVKSIRFHEHPAQREASARRQEWLAGKDGSHEAYPEKLSKLSDAELSEIAKQKPIPFPGMSEASERAAKEAWDVVSRLLPEAAKTIKQIGVGKIPTKTGVAHAGVSPSGILIVGKNKLSPDTLFHELVHRQQVAEGRFVRRQDRTDEQHLEMERESYARQGQMVQAKIFERLQEAVAKETEDAGAANRPGDVVPRTEEVVRSGKEAGIRDVQDEEAATEGRGDEARDRAAEREELEAEMNRQDEIEAKLNTKLSHAQRENLKRELEESIRKISDLTQPVKPEAEPEGAEKVQELLDKSSLPERSKKIVRLLIGSKKITYDEIAAKIAPVGTKPITRARIGQLVDEAREKLSHVPELRSAMDKSKAELQEREEQEGPASEVEKDIAETEEKFGRVSRRGTAAEMRRLESDDPGLWSGEAGSWQVGGLINWGEIGKAGAAGLGKLRAFFKKMLSGNMPTIAEKLNQKRLGAIRAMIQELHFTERDFRAAVKKEYGADLEKLDEVETDELDDALRGLFPYSALPTEVAQLVEQMRIKVDALSDELIALGLIDSALELEILENKGTYLHRSYQVHTDRKWEGKIDPQVRNTFKAWLRNEFVQRPFATGQRYGFEPKGPQTAVPGPMPTDEQLENIITTLLTAGKAKELLEKSDPILYRLRTGEKDTSALKEREDLPPELRALFGEVKNPLANYASTVGNIATLIANHQFLSEVLRQGDGVFLSKHAGTKGMHVQFGGGPAMLPLADVYTTPEVKQAFSELFDIKNLPPWLQWYMKVNSAVKYGKTVASPETHLNNFAGNPMFLLAQGNVGAVTKVPAIFKALAAASGTKDSQVARDYLLDLVRRGIVGDGIHAGELKQVFGDALGRETDLNEFIGRILTNPTRFKQTVGVVKMGKKAAEKLYEWEDAIWKIIAYENEQARYRAAYKGKWTDEQVKDNAATIVRNTMATYSMVPDIIKAMRVVPFIGGFMAFQSEAIRVVYHTIKLIAAEMSVPETRSIGARRLIGLTAAAAVPMAASLATAFMVGMDDDDREALRRFLPKWMKNDWLLYLGKHADGSYRTPSTSRINPFGLMQSTVLAFWHGQDWQDKLWQATKTMGTPFVGEDILAGAIIDVLQKEKSSGAKIYNEQDTGLNIVVNSGSHILEAIEPSLIKTLRKAGIKAIYGTTRKEGTDVAKVLSIKGMAFEAAEREAKGLLDKFAKDKGASDAAIERAYANMERARQQLFQELYRDYHAAIRLDVPEKDAKKILKNAGLSDIEVSHLAKGVYTPYKPADTYLEAVGLREGDKQTFRDRRKFIAGLAKKQPGFVPTVK